VEDSRLARLELKEQLNGVSFIDVIAEAASVAEAKSKYDEHQPDLIFLDIDLPDGNGFDFLANIKQDPAVIFTTAHQEFAIKAFESRALDYLLKPYTTERLLAACTRAKEVYEQQQGEEELSMDSQFFVKDGNQCWMVRLSEVERFEAQGNYTQVYFADNKPFVYRTLNKIEPRLPKGKFFRISRQNIVQLNHIVHVEPCSSGGLELRLKSGAVVEVSRRQSSLFRSMLSL
jgi:two-component system LytT family response regulator